MSYLEGYRSVAVQANNQGNNVVIASQGAGTIRVSLAQLIADADQRVKFISRMGTEETDLTGLMRLDAGQGFRLRLNRAGYFETSPGADLVLYLANPSAPVAGWLNFQRLNIGQIISEEQPPPVPFAPGQLEGLQLWLKADALELSDNDPVAVWPDASAEGNDAVQPTAPVRPTFKTDIINSLPVVRFGGNPYHIYVPSLALGAFTILAVWRVSISGIVYEHSTNLNSNEGCYLYTHADQTVKVHRASGFSSYDKAANWAQDNTWRITAHRFDGTHVGHQLWISGEQQSMSVVQSDDPGLSVATDRFDIFSDNGSQIFATGDLAELIIYNASLSDEDREQVEAYLNEKYAIV